MTQVPRRLAATLAAALALAVPAEPRAEEPLAGAIARAVDAFNRDARFPLPALSASQRARLARGQVVKVRQVPEDRDRPQRVLGLHVAQAPRDHAWLGCLDPHYVVTDGLTEVRLTDGDDGSTRWYGFLDLPWPFADRQWVVDTANNVQLAASSGNAAWERWWRLAPDGERVALEAVRAGRVPGVSADVAARAIFTPVNHGAWVVVDLPGDRALIGYHVTSVVGGAIPDRLVADYALSTMQRLLRGAARRARQVLDHYRPGHAPLLGGDGRAIPFAPR